MTQFNTSIDSPARPTSTQSLESRIARNERRNRMLASGLIGIGGIGIGGIGVGGIGIGGIGIGGIGIGGIGIGAAMMAAQQATPPATDGGAVRCKPVSITIDPTRGSGR